MKPADPAETPDTMTPNEEPDLVTRVSALEEAADVLEAAIAEQRKWIDKRLSGRKTKQ